MKKGSFRGNWLSRHFKLHVESGLLTYTTSAASTDVKGTVQLLSTSTVTTVPNKYDHHFVINMVVTEKGKTRKELALRAESQEDCEMWKKSLNYAIGILQLGIHHY